MQHLAVLVRLNLPYGLLLAINSKKHTIDTEATNYKKNDDTFYAMTLAYLNKK